MNILERIVRSDLVASSCRAFNTTFDLENDLSVASFVFTKENDGRVDFSHFQQEALPAASDASILGVRVYFVHLRQESRPVMHPGTSRRARTKVHVLSFPFAGRVNEFRYDNFQPSIVTLLAL